MIELIIKIRIMNLEYYQKISGIYSKYPIVSNMYSCNNVRVRGFLWIAFETFIEKYKNGVVRYNIYFDNECVTLDMIEIVMNTLKELCPGIEFMTIYPTMDSFGYVQIRWKKNPITDEFIDIYLSNLDLCNYIISLCDESEIV